MIERAEQKESYGMRATAAFIAVAFAASLSGYIFWYHDRGIDITDEGYYLLTTCHPEDVSGCNSFFYLYGSIIFSALGRNTVHYRVVGQLALIASSLALAFGLGNIIRHVFNALNSRAEATILGAVSVLGAMLYYSWFLRSPSYNMYSTVSLSLGIGFCAAVLAHQELKRSSFVYLTLSGIFLSIALFVKCTSAAAVISILFLLIFLRPEWRLRQKIATVALIGAGILAWLCFHFLFLLGPSDTVRVFRRGVEFARTLGAGYGLGLIRGYITELKFALRVGVLDFAPAFGFLAITEILRLLRPTFYSHGQSRILPSVAIVIGGACSLINRHDRGGMSQLDNMTGAWLGWLFLLIACCIIAGLRMTKGTLKEKVKSVGLFRVGLIALLFGLPFLTAFGTNNHITQNSLFFMAPWLILYFVLLTLVSRFSDTGLPLVLGAVIAGGLCFAQIYEGSRLDPYRLTPPIGIHTHLPEQMGMKGLPMLDEKTYMYSKELGSLAASSGLKPGADLLAFYNHPGLVFMLGARSPGMPWYSDDYYGSPSSARLALKWAGAARLSQSYVLFREDRLQEITSCLNDCGARFPDAYELCGSVWCPFNQTRMQLWRPKQP